MPKRSNLLGKTFGRLTVLAEVPAAGHTRWRCQCACGKTLVVRSNNLISCNQKSCGCARKVTPHAERAAPVDPRPRYSTDAALMLSAALGLPTQ